ncbi:MAG TPA: hypothetical protein VJ842_17475 [Pyrinomonadaceae bacterium]|nr:hypothetical protein [Pyrinomonadaceae bacterium]
MRILCFIVALCIPFSIVSAQTPSSNTSPPAKPQARLIDTLNTGTISTDKDRQDYPAEQLIKELGKGIKPPPKITVKGTLNISGLPDREVIFTDAIFEEDVNVNGHVKSIKFDHCQFKQNVDFYELESDSLRISNCKFNGSVWFILNVRNFELRKCEFEKIVDFGNTDLQKTSITMTRLISREPIRIDWAQFGDRWLEEMKNEDALNLGGGDKAYAQKRNLIDVQRELEFWRNNFSALGHERDANKVNYEINLLGTEGVRLERGSIEWFEAKLFSLPNRYGTSPYRPLIAGLFVIVLFALIYLIADPFVPGEDKKSPKPKKPLFLFSLMYSIDTFIPVIDVTKVRDWGWEMSPAYRWVTVTERLLGLVVFYSATYSLAYYIF